MKMVRAFGEGAPGSTRRVEEARAFYLPFSTTTCNSMYVIISVAPIDTSFVEPLPGSAGWCVSHEAV